MILSGRQIEDRSSGSEQKKLIEPFDSGNVRRSSYDLTIGDEYYCGDNGEKKTALETYKLGVRHTFSIPAHGVCFILCNETIALPDDISARVSLRMSLIYHGLILTAQPPFDPGYAGKVIVMLHNLSSRPIPVSSGDRLATIEFMKVEGAATGKSPHRSVSNLAGQLKAPLTSSLVKIDLQARKANRKVNLFLGQLLSIVALLFAIPTSLGFILYGVVTDKIADAKSNIAKLEQTASSQKKEIEELKVLLATAGAASNEVDTINSRQNLERNSVQP